MQTWLGFNTTPHSTILSPAFLLILGYKVLPQEEKEEKFSGTKLELQQLNLQFTPSPFLIRIRVDLIALSKATNERVSELQQFSDTYVS